MRTGTRAESTRGRSSLRAGTTTTALPVRPSTSVTVYSTRYCSSPIVARIDWSVTWARGSSAVTVRSQGEPSASLSLSRTGTVTVPSAATWSTVTWSSTPTGLTGGACAVTWMVRVPTSVPPRESVTV